MHWANSEGHNQPLLYAVNMASLSTSGQAKDGIMKALLKKLGSQRGSKKEDHNIDTLRKWARKDAIILIIDEIDMLIKARDSDGEIFLRELVGLARDEDLKFSLIGISNSVNDKSSARIKQMGVVSLLSKFVMFLSPSHMLFFVDSRKSLCSLPTMKRVCSPFSNNACQMNLWMSRPLSW